jgi:hypothetical protein
MKTWVLNRYDGGMKILFESKNNKKYFIWALIIVGCLKSPLCLLFLLKNLNITQSHHAEIPLLVFFLNNILNTSILSPIFEEVVYRSFIYRALKKKIGITSGILITSILFTAMHLQLYLYPERLITIFIFGLILNLFYEKTGSLYNCILVHFLSNFTKNIVLKFFPA